MPRYLTRVQLEPKFPGGPALLLQTCDDTGDAGFWTSAATAVCDGQIERAENMVDSYLQGRYTVPLATVPPVILDAVAELAAWYLISRRGYNEDGPDKSVKITYDARIKWLEQVNRGKIDLGVSDPAPQSSVRVSAPPKTFDLDKF